MKKFLSIVSFLVLFCTSALAVTVGSVTGQMGSTWNERDGSIEQIIQGYELEMKDFLQTGEDGAMNLLFKDNTKVTIAPNTEFLIDEFAFDTSVIPIELAMNISINVGTFTYESGDVKKLGGEVELVTPTATITMQGTAFSGTVDTSGATTITLLPDSQGDVGQVTVTNDAGSQTLTGAYTSVTVLTNDLAPTPPKIVMNKTELFDLETNEDNIEEKHDLQKDRKEFNETITDEGEAQKLEEAIISEEATITETADTYDATSDLGSSGTETILDTKSAEEVAVDQSVLESDVDTSYYDEWEDDLKDWGYIDEDNQISVWDAEGEQTMDWDEAKKMYSEMDQAYFDAIGCSDCTWDTINWDEVNWDEVDWDAYNEAYNETLEKYGLTSYTMEVEDVSEEVEEEATSTVEGYTWEDFALDDAYYSNAEYNNQGGPPTLTTQNYCEYNGYDSSWCTQEYVDWLNEWYQDDWDLKVTYDSWTTESIKIFSKMYGWCGSWPNWEMCDSQPKPWKMKDLKTKYISDWTWDDYDTYWDALYDWWYTGYDYNNEDNWEDEYSFEDDFDIDAELVLLLASYDEEECLANSYYWDNANQSCGSTWVDNEGNETSVTASGETLNYTTGDVTQTLTTTDGLTGATSSATSTGRVSTLNNDFDADIDTSVSGYSIINRYNDSHRTYLKIETADEADVQILQDMEAQHLDIGSSSSQQNITIIQTD